MFVKELRLYVEYLKEEIKNTFNPVPRDIKGWTGFCNNLLEGVSHYRKLAEQELIKKKEAFEQGLNRWEAAVLEIKAGLESR